jgi:hypothetical protein
MAHSNVTRVGANKLAFIAGNEENSPVFRYFFANRGLGQSSVVNLLLSSSFGVNALLYAAWLGYLIGAWALLIQLSWAVSFFLMGRYARHIGTITSLHDFVGVRFGATTKLTAAICSLVGFVILIGWEVAVAKSTLTSIDVTYLSPAATNFLVFAIISVAVFYSLSGGLRANAIWDIVANSIKVIILLGLTAVILLHAVQTSTTSVVSGLFPPFSTVIEKLGFFGLVTNIVFNLSWQLVDNSSWQSVVAGSGRDQFRTRDSLSISGVLVFLTIGFLGTLLGASFSGTPEVTPDNILFAAVQSVGISNGIAHVAMLVLISCAVMAFLDGMFMAAAQTIVTDILPMIRQKNRSFNESNLTTARWTLFSFAIFSAVGTLLFQSLTGMNVFDFVYVVVIAQLSLLGPIAIGYIVDRPIVHFMWLSIVGGNVVGFGCVFLGTLKGLTFLVDGAGTFTLLTSLLLALSLFVVQKDQKLTTNVIQN